MQFLNLQGLQTLWANILTKLNLKVDKTTKINGKALSGDITLTASDVNALPNTTQLKDLADDASHRTGSDTEKATWNAKSDFSGNYNDLTNKPTIPSVEGLATVTYVDEQDAKKVDKVTGKGLSTNDYTNEDKNLLATIAADYLTSTEVKGSGAATASVENGVVTINVPVVTADSLGLSSAMLFLGTTTTAITDGSTTSSISVGGKTVAVKAGNVVLYGSKEFVWNGSAWEELGNEGSYKVVQEAVASPTASGDATAFIDTISQDTNGKITVTKKNVSFPTLSGGAAAANDATITGGVTVSGHAVTVAKKTLEAGANVTITGGTDKITIAAKDTTYEDATESKAGLMTAAMVTKLKGIAENANNYTLPTAGATLGGVKTTSTVSSTSGLTPSPIIDGVVYYKDTNTEYTAITDDQINEICK